jgi:hypothetical protein
MGTTPFIESETKDPLGGIAHRYVFSRGVKGLVQPSGESARVVVFLSFPDKTDSVMWEPKRVLPLLAPFDALATPSIDSWALTFPAAVAQEALLELDAIIGERRFYA